MIDKQTKLNLSVAAFEVPIANLFQFKDGKYVAILKPLRKLIDDIANYGNFKIHLKVTLNGQFGRLTPTGYHDGVLGMIQDGEADSAFIPVPVNTPEPPGWFTPIIQEESFYIYSIPYSSTRKTQDISKSLIVYDLMIIWLTVLFVTYAFEIVIVSTEKGSLQKLTTNLWNTLSGYWSILFAQFNPERGINNSSLIRITQSYLLLISLCLFNATFNTSAVIGETRGKIDTLRDVVLQDKTPVFLEGLSLFELFQVGVTKDHREVYKQAQRKDSHQPFGLSSTDLFETLSPRHAVLVSERAGRSGLVIPSKLGNKFIDRIYQSKKPYHRGLLAFIVNPKYNVEETKRRLSKLAIRSLQANLLDEIFIQVLDQFMLSIDFLDINAFDIIKRNLEPDQDDRIFYPLKLDGIVILFQVYLVLIIFTIVTHLIELSIKLLIIIQKNI